MTRIDVILPLVFGGMFLNTKGIFYGRFGLFELVCLLRKVVVERMEFLAWLDYVVSEMLILVAH